MGSLLKWASAWFGKLVWGWCVVSAALLTLGVVLSVVLRYVFSVTFVWAEEAITTLFVATTFFGAAVAFKENEHINIGFLVEKLPRRTRKVLSVLELVILGGMHVVIIVSSWDWIGQVGKALTPGLRIPIRFFYSMIPAGAVLTLLFIAGKAVSVFREDTSDRT